MVKQTRNTEFRQRQIVEAARLLIFKYGSEHVTIRRIAKEVHLSEAAIYRHFQSKTSIMALLADHIGVALLNDIAVAENTGVKAIELLSEALRNHISAVEQRRGVSFQVIAEIISLGDKKLNRRVLDNIQRYLDRLTVLIAQGIERGEIRPTVNPASASQMIFGMIQGLANLWTLSNRGFDIEERYAELWKLFASAIRNDERNLPAQAEIRSGTLPG